jgi:multiple sugar transport system substrate-binding protein
MRPYSLLHAAAAAAVAGMLAGSAAAQTTLTFRFNDTEEKEMREALDRFEKSNPGVKVTLQRISWRDARDQFLREAALGQGPDVAHIAFVWAREMGQAGAIKPLGDLVRARPPAHGLEDFIALELARGPKGEVYALPWTTDTWAMVYRTDLLEQAGVSALPNTWDDLKRASAQVHKATGRAGFGFPAGSSASGGIWFLANYHWWSNGKALVIQKPDGSFGLGVTAAEVADTMRFFRSFMTEGHTPTSLLSASDAHDPAIIEALAAGRQAIGFMPPNTYKQVLDAYSAANPGKPLPFVSGPIPKGSVTRTSHLGGRMLAVNSSTKHPNEAWKLIQYLSEPAIFTEFYRNQFPAQRTLLKQVDFGPEMKGFAEQLGYARTWGPYADGPAPIGAMWNATGRAFGAALAGQKSEDAAAAELVESVSKLMQSRQQ